jgi:amidase
MTTPNLDWKQRAAARKAQQELTFPKEWIIKDLPSKETLNVVDIPETCGILTPKEIQITTSNVSLLLKNLAEAIWSSVEVTTAFAKRAVIAHQLVRSLRSYFLTDDLTAYIVGQLPH